MLKKLLTLTILVCGLALMSCSNSSKKMPIENVDQSETSAKSNRESNLSKRLISTYEKLGVQLTDSQIKQIQELVDTIVPKELSKEEKKELLKKTRENIDQNVLTEEQKLILNKNGK